MNCFRIMIGSALVLAIAAAVSVRAQPATEIPRIAYVVGSGETTDLTEDHPNYGEFFRELRRLGYVEGQSIMIERHSARGEGLAAIARMSSRVVESKPDLIVARARNVMAAFIAASDAIPVVGVGTFPAEFQTNLARPRGNVTGYSTSAADAVYMKRVQLLLEAVPTASRFAWIGPRRNWEGSLGESYRKAAAAVNVELVALPVEAPEGEAETRRAFSDLANVEADALILSLVSQPYRPLSVELAVASRLPTVGSGRRHVEQGIVMSYFANWTERERRAAYYVNRILQGAQPADLPIEQPTMYDFIINLRTARALGIEIPPKLLIQATELID